MRVFIDECVVMVVEITKAKRTRRAESGCQRDRATSWAGSIVTGLLTCVPSRSISSNMVAGSASQMRTVPSSPQVANITAVGHHTAELTPFFWCPGRTSRRVPVGQCQMYTWPSVFREPGQRPEQRKHEVTGRKKFWRTDLHIH
jgi:hypothetical protein